MEKDHVLFNLVKYCKARVLLQVVFLKLKKTLEDGCNVFHFKICRCHFFQTYGLLAVNRFSPDLILAFSENCKYSHIDAFHMTLNFFFLLSTFPFPLFILFQSKENRYVVWVTFIVKICRNFRKLSIWCVSL